MNTANDDQGSSGAPEATPATADTTPKTHLLPNLPDPNQDDNTVVVEAKKEGWRNLFSTIFVIGIALLTAVFLTTFVFQYYQVDGQSMETTLDNNDRLLVWKAPRTLARITHHPYIPHRGDVVIFGESGLGVSDQTNTKQLIKRVIALPGEKVVVGNGTIIVYNKAHPEGFQPDKTMPYGKNITSTPGEGTYILKENEIFVCGDNRGNSLDSRYFGPISADNIVGKLILRIIPLDKAQTF